MEGGRSEKSKKREKVRVHGSMRCNKEVDGGVRKHLFGKSSLGKRGNDDDDFVSQSPFPKRASGIDKGKRAAFPTGSGHGKDNMVVQKRYTNEMFQLIMDNSPMREEEMLRKMGFDDLIHQGMTSIFRGGCSFIIAVEKLKRVCIDWRRVRKEKEELSKKAEDLAHELGEVKKERDLFAREHARSTLAMENMQDLYLDMQVDAEKGRKHDAEVVEAINRLTSKVAEGREREEKLSFEIHNQFLQGVKA